MRIKHIEINNFKSIEELQLDLDRLNGFLGPNSSGKTNVLKAIDLVLGEGWATKAKVARELFNDVSRNIDIKIEFDTPIEWMYYGTPKLIRTVTLVMKLEPLSCEVRLWENYPNDRNGDGYYMNDEFKKLCHFIYIPSDRQLSSELRVSNWTMLGKLMKLVYENYITHYEDETKLKEKFAEEIKPAKDFLENDFQEDAVTYKKFVDTFKKHCKSNSAGLANDFEPVLDIYNLNWFYKTLQIHVKEQHHDKHFDSEEVGAGMQNLLMLSIFQTYSELMGGKVIFGVEEPEIYLYPQAQRSLFKSFQELSTNTQIFYTTHNPNFVDAARAYEVCLLRKSKERGTFILEQNKDVLAQDTAERERFKIYTHFNTERNELFFANKVILVEGPSDKILWTTLAEDQWDIDLDREGISVIECNGKGGVIYFIGLCRLCGIKDYFAVWDQDSDLEYEDAHQNLQYSLNTNSGLEIKGNLEDFLKLPSGNKVKNAYEWASSVDTQSIPDEFNVVKDFILGDTDEEGITENISSEIINPNDLPF